MAFSSRRRVDGNHGEIVDALRSCGAMVQSLAMVGNGVPDLLVIHAGTVHLIEVKDGRKPQSARTLTAAEQRWHTWAHAAGYRVSVVTCVADAMQVLLRNW